jgi:hypothetical protein
VLNKTIYFVAYKWDHKLECPVTLGWKGFPGKNTLAYWANIFSEQGKPLKVL